VALPVPNVELVELALATRSDGYLQLFVVLTDETAGAKLYTMAQTGANSWSDWQFLWKGAWIG
jgi:hypothetical protein